jgi:GntR family transcriptional regulator
MARGDERPVYLKLRDHIAGAILTGKYSDGDMLPSVRAFASDHGVNPLTVAKAYQTFQDEGLVVVRRGIGMFVADGATARLQVSERQHFLDFYWPMIVDMMERLDFDPAELLERARQNRPKESVPTLS